MGLWVCRTGGGHADYAPAVPRGWRSRWGLTGVAVAHSPLAGACPGDASAGPYDGPEVRHAARRAAGDAVHLDALRGGPRGPFLRDRCAAVSTASPAGWFPCDDGVELRVGQPPGHVQLSGVHHRGGGRCAGAGAVEQRAGGRKWRLFAAPAARGSHVALGQPAGRARGAGFSSDVLVHTWPLYGTRPAGDALARRSQHRGERRLRRGLVPAPGAQHRRPCPRRHPVPAVPK